MKVEPATTPLTKPLPVCPICNVAISGHLMGSHARTHAPYYLKKRKRTRNARLGRLSGYDAI